MGVYCVSLGATPSDMGWFQSSTNISNNLMQIFWGRLSDNLKQRVPFIVTGSLILSLLWLPMAIVATPSQLIILLALQALLGSMATPAWTALIGDLVPSLKLGRANAQINLYASIGGLIATLASGLYMQSIGGALQQKLLIPFIVATATGVAASIIMLRIKEHKGGEKINWRQGLTETFNIIRQARAIPDFARYCTVDATFQFFMSISWPLFSITQIRILNANILQIALLSLVQSIITILFLGWAGRLADTLGRRPLLIIFRLGLVTVPLAYAFIPNVNVLILVGIFWGVINALGAAAQTAYILELCPAACRGSFTAVYNLLVGIVTFTGSLIAGYLTDYMIALFGLGIGLQIVYSVSTVGRAVGAGMHFRLKETLKKQD
jgi:MFS family permease